MESDFDQKVAALRGKVPAKKVIRKKKSDCTPEEWAGNLNYYAARYAANPEPHRQRASAWAKDNREKNRVRQRRQRDADREKYREMRRAYYRSDLQVTEAIRARNKRWKQNNKEKARESHRISLSDPSRKLAADLRIRLNVAVKGGVKQGSAVHDLGCTIAELWDHLESKFQPGMTRENRGKVWVIDHMYPLSKANLIGSRTEFLAANNWRNLQPLTKAQNMEKGNRVTPEAQVLFDQLCAEFREQVAA